MITLSRISIIIAVALLAVFTRGQAAQAAEGIEKPALLVLVVSPETDSSLIKGIADLLKEHNVTVSFSNWKQATHQRASGFDLVIIAGECGRRARFDRSRVVLDYDVPVLGIGSYGCHYFGLTKLKNGHPYT